ncbi:hypothetical protein RJ639_041211 [Escallonia herrerae]|uniref:K-box domain-containing protein n=1 Tax=Escallonia herrerae TaxID=1293975 RepID=A0AA88WKN8_9ASTE|nr:hypothetical protein RJ639_041211 [Escallonia herrerae]
MEKILERYERYSYVERQLVANEPESPGNWTLEYNKLKPRIDLLQRNHRHYMGEDLDSLSLKEIQSLEQQLDSALKHIRSRKNQLMYESISELQRKIKEKEKTMAQQVQWEQQQNRNPSSSSFLVPQVPVPRLNIGGGNIYQGEAPEERRNELNLTLEPIYTCNLGCFAL